MADKIEGVPEGWDLVHAMRRAITGEHYIDSDGFVSECLSENESMFAHPIIRKIEKPAKFRPFKDAEEYLPNWGRPVRTKGYLGFDSVVSTSEYAVYVNSGASKARYTMAEAFEQLTFADGTPFGVKIDE